MRSFIAVPILALLLLAACGGGESDGDAVRSAVTEAVTTDNPSVCDRRFTERFLKKSLGPGGIEQCKSLRDGHSDSVKNFRVESVRVVGDRAEAHVKTDMFGRERYVLVKTGDGWRIDGMERL